MWDPVERQSELERLDRQWEKERARYMVRGRLGSLYVPSAAAALLMGAIAVGFGAFWFVMTFELAAGEAHVFWVFLLLGVIFLPVWIGISVHQLRKARRYQVAFAAYRHRRAQLEGRPRGGAADEPIR